MGQAVRVEVRGQPAVVSFLMGIEVRLSDLATSDFTLTGPSPVLLNMTFKVLSCVGWDCSPVVEYLPRMCDTLDSIPVLQNKRNQIK